MLQTIFETPRLILKTSNESMARETLRFYQSNKVDFEATEPIYHPDFYTEHFQATMLKYERSEIRKGKMLRLWIFRREDPDRIIGTVSFHNIRHGSFCDCETGYKMDAAFRRNGYCKEALAFGMSLMFDSYHLHRITAIVLPENNASIQLLESLGYEKEGLLKQNVLLQGTWKSHYIFAYVRS